MSFGVVVRGYSKIGKRREARTTGAGDYELSFRLALSECRTL
jgi:hypothetical protein